MSEFSPSNRLSLASTISPSERDSRDQTRTAIDFDDEAELLKSTSTHTRSDEDTQTTLTAERDPQNRNHSDDTNKTMQPIKRPMTITLPPTKFVNASASLPAPISLATSSSGKGSTAATELDLKMPLPAHNPADFTPPNGSKPPSGVLMPIPPKRSHLSSPGPQIPIEMLEGGPLRHKLNLNEKFRSCFLTKSHARRRALFSVSCAILCIVVIAVVWGITGDGKSKEEHAKPESSLTSRMMHLESKHEHVQQ